MEYLTDDEKVLFIKKAKYYSIIKDMNYDKILRPELFENLKEK